VSDDRWVEVTVLGDAEPSYVLAVSGIDIDIARACVLYVEGRIDIEQFERRVDEALSRPRSEP
jgi:hypothetical protein